MRTRIFFDPCMGMFKNNQMVRKEFEPLLVGYNKKNTGYQKIHYYIYQKNKLTQKYIYNIDQKTFTFVRLKCLKNMQSKTISN